MEAKESESAIHCRLLRERDEEMIQKGKREVVESVLAIIENPRQFNYRLKEITEYCEAQLLTNKDQMPPEEHSPEPAFHHNRNMPRRVK